jgi:hypothetical protein
MGNKNTFTTRTRNVYTYNLRASSSPSASRGQRLCRPSIFNNRNFIFLLYTPCTYIVIISRMYSRPTDSFIYWVVKISSLLDTVRVWNLVSSYLSYAVVCNNINAQTRARIYTTDEIYLRAFDGCKLFYFSLSSVGLNIGERFIRAGSVRLYTCTQFTITTPFVSRIPPSALYTVRVNGPDVYRSTYVYIALFHSFWKRFFDKLNGYFFFRVQRVASTGRKRYTIVMNALGHVGIRVISFSRAKRDDNNTIRSTLSVRDTFKRTYNGLLTRGKSHSVTVHWGWVIDYLGFVFYLIHKVSAPLPLETPGRISRHGNE